jgi:aminopeptidase-like protein
MPPVSLTAEQADRNDQGWGRYASSSPSTQIGQEIYQLIAQLYPICRSITGNGVRATLKILREYIPLEIREVPTGTQVFDWTVPKEWNIKTAYIRDSQGRTVIDFEKSNLHVLSYSVPVHTKLTLAELKKHIYTLPEHPDWIPYRTSYYKENWGFCLSHKQLLDLHDGDYEVVIDTSLEDGHLTYGEFFLKGESDSEVLISTHVCHPSLANDNLSGMALATFLAKHLSEFPSRYSYRFLFTPGTIGSITWLSLNEFRASRIKHGLVLACVGDPGHITYKKSRRGDAEIDRIVSKVLKDRGEPYEIFDFSPYGYDERQFCSPGFNLPLGCFMRTPHGKFPEYHTSADNLELVQPQSLGDSLSKCLMILETIEENRRYLNLNPKCEPQLGKRGLYGAIGGATDGKVRELAMLWVLNLSDGKHTLLDVAEKSHLPFPLIKKTADALLEHNLLKEFAEAAA